jgi:hypothetical protein
MRTWFLSLFLATACLGAEPAGVDGLTPGDVAKAITAIQSNFVRPDQLSDADIQRATLQGLLDRLGPEVIIESGTAGGEEAEPFHAEICDGHTGYLRLGEMGNVAQARQTLMDWTGQGVKAVVLDLRGTPPSNDFQAGASLAELFCPKGTEVFSLEAPSASAFASFKEDPSQQPKPQGSGPSQSLTFTAESDPVFTGVLVVLVDGETAEAPEAVAASLQKCAKALVVGETTAGRAFEFADFPLGGQTLRIAVARVILPDGKEPGEKGLAPDIAVGLEGASKEDLMHTVTARGIGPAIAEHDLPHLNEAALVSGSNPEIDELEAEESGQRPPESMLDRQLEQALDLVTSISIYQSKDAGKQ